MVLFPICFQLLPTNGLHAAQTCKNTGAFPHFVCITVRQGPTLPKWLDMSILSILLPPFFLHIRTHRLHADQILQSMGTSPNYSNLCYTCRVNAGQTFFESITASQNSPTNRVCGTMSKAAGFIFWRIFPASC